MLLEKKERKNKYEKNYPTSEKNNEKQKKNKKCKL